MSLLCSALTSTGLGLLNHLGRDICDLGRRRWSQGGRGGNIVNPKLMLRDVRAGRLPTRPQLHDVVQEEPPTPVHTPLFIYAKCDLYGSSPDWALESRGLGHNMATRYSLKWDTGWVLPIQSPEPGKAQESLWGWQWKRMSLVLNWPDEVKEHHLVRSAGAS